MNANQIKNLALFQANLLYAGVYNLSRGVSSVQHYFNAKMLSIQEENGRIHVYLSFTGNRDLQICMYQASRINPDGSVVQVGIETQHDFPDMIRDLLQSGFNLPNVIVEGMSWRMCSSEIFTDSDNNQLRLHTGEQFNQFDKMHSLFADDSNEFNNIQTSDPVHNGFLSEYNFEIEKIIFKTKDLEQARHAYHDGLYFEEKITNPENSNEANFLINERAKLILTVVEDESLYQLEPQRPIIQLKPVPSKVYEMTVLKIRKGIQKTPLELDTIDESPDGSYSDILISGMNWRLVKAQKS